MGALLPPKSPVHPLKQVGNWKFDMFPHAHFLQPMSKLLHILPLNLLHKHNILLMHFLILLNPLKQLLFTNHLLLLKFRPINSPQMPRNHKRTTAINLNPFFKSNNPDVAATALNCWKDVSLAATAAIFNLKQSYVFSPCNSRKITALGVTLTSRIMSLVALVATLFVADLIFELPVVACFLWVFCQKQAQSLATI